VADAACDAFAERYAARVPQDPDTSPTVLGLAACHLLAALGPCPRAPRAPIGMGSAGVCRRWQR